MNKNKREWTIGSILLFVILLIASLAAGNWYHILKSDKDQVSTTIAVNRNLDNVSNENNINQYLYRQDEIMADSLEAMRSITKSGSASIDFLNRIIPLHESMIYLSETYLSYGGFDGQLKTLAQNIIQTRQEEITTYQDFIRQLKTEENGMKEKEEAFLVNYENFLGQIQEAGKTDAGSLEHAYADGIRKLHQKEIRLTQLILDDTNDKEIRSFVENIIFTQELEQKTLISFN